MKHQDDIVLVTGSNGRIGSAVMRRLRRRFDNVVDLDRKAPGPPPPDCVAIPVDITSDESMWEGLRVLRAHHGARFRQADLVLNPVFRRTVDMLDFAARRECVAAGVHAVRAQRATIDALLAPEAVPSMPSGDSSAAARPDAPHALSR